MSPLRLHIEIILQAQSLRSVPVQEISRKEFLHGKVRCPRIRLTANFYRLDHRATESPADRSKKLFRNSIRLPASSGSFFPRLLIRLNSISAMGLISRFITTFCSCICAECKKEAPRCLRRDRSSQWRAWSSLSARERGPAATGQLARNLVESETNALCLAMAVPL